MPRKRKGIKEIEPHEFTRQIHSTKRRGTPCANMENWNEKQAQADKKVSCKDCRRFWWSGNCYEYIGRWHKPCKDFQWS